MPTVMLPLQAALHETFANDVMPTVPPVVTPITTGLLIEQVFASVAVIV